MNLNNTFTSTTSIFVLTLPPRVAAFLRARHGASEGDDDVSSAENPQSRSRRERDGIRCLRR